MVKVSASSTRVIWTDSWATFPDKRRVKSKPAIPAPRTRIRVDGCIMTVLLSISDLLLNFPSHSLSRDVVVMTITCDHHKERGLSCPFWDRCQSGFAHANHIARP